VEIYIRVPEEIQIPDLRCDVKIQKISDIPE
jgi:hypothetical protein